MNIRHFKTIYNLIFGSLRFALVIMNLDEPLSFLATRRATRNYPGGGCKLVHYAGARVSGYRTFFQLYFCSRCTIISYGCILYAHPYGQLVYAVSRMTFRCIMTAEQLFTPSSSWPRLGDVIPTLVREAAGARE